MLRKLRYPYICLGLIVFLIIIFNTPTLFAAEALLSWDPPTTNADGTTLTDLSGYIVHYGTESGNYISSIDVGNVNTYTISTLTAGVRYYFSATAYDTSGNESSYSNEVSANIPVPTPVDYYCDNDSDGYISSFISGSCTGTGCKPSGCQTTAGNDCSDSNAGINPGAADDNCNGVDDNCDGTADNNYVITIVSCGTGVCVSAGQLTCVDGTETNACTPGLPSEETESTCDNLDNDCDGTTDEGCAPVISVSKVLISEDFSQGIPGTWAAQGAWNTDNTCGKSIGSSFEGAYAIVDSSCSQTHADELTTGSFNTVSCNSVDLIFSNQYYWYSGNIAVNASSDGGQTWASEHYADSNEGYPTADWKELNISDIAESENAKIRFRYLNDSTDGFWAMDNVWVICQADQIAFSSQVGSASAPQEIMISNPGTEDLAIAAINLTGTGAADFAIGPDDNCS
ncbi:MAG: MopE-related protein, partial [Candidatus Saccharibacteria bacterium]|nr:MopE-related protein [Candidatus Saccharibacteria bacterium]